MLQPLKRPKLHESISEAVLNYIHDTGFEVGERLPSERFFCGQFQISRASFREAMKKLESYGVIEIRAGSGMYLRAERSLIGEVANLKLHISMEKKAVLEMLDLREMMEQYAIEQIVKHNQSACLDRLGEIIKVYETKRAKGDIPRQEDYLFHKTLYEGSNNQMLYNLFISMKEMEYLWAERVFDSVDVLVFGRETEPLHGQIYEAMRANDVIIAKQLMNKHFDILRNDLVTMEHQLFP